MSELVYKTKDEEILALFAMMTSEEKDRIIALARCLSSEREQHPSQYQ